MTDGWAYTAYGNLKVSTGHKTYGLDHTTWDWFGPIATEEAASSFKGRLYQAASTRFYNTDDNDVCVIGYDGKNWLVGRFALPSTFLNPETYPPEHYSYTDLRKHYILHGYQSESGDFPERIPLLSRERVAELHIQNILPIWDGQKVYHREDKTVTSFEPLRDGVDIAEQVPQEAVAKLRAAHAQGKPIAIWYDPESKKCGELGQFGERYRDDSMVAAAERQAAEGSVGWRMKVWPWTRRGPQGRGGG